jgi:cytochrome c-type biogenesis protein CcmF
VHTFAISAIGSWFLGFLFVCIVFSVVLLAARANRLAGRVEPTVVVSREGAFALQNLLLIGVVVVVIWGTILPLVSGMVGQQRVVGTSYYESAAGPLLVVILALMAAGPLLPWGRAFSDKARLEPYSRALLWPGATALVVLAALVIAGERSIPALVVLPLASAVAATCFTQFARLGRGWAVVWRLRRRYGAYLAHLGLALLVIGIAASHFWQQEKNVTLAPGQEVTVAGYTLTYAGTVERQLADHTELVGAMRFGATTLEPARATYVGLGGQSLTHVAISTTPLADVYVVLAGANNDGSASFRIFVNPLVSWIWAGAAIIIFGVMLGNLGERAPALEIVTRRVPATVHS